jgi:hypothetical protein
MIPQFKAVPPFPIVSKMTLSSNTVIAAEIFVLEYRGVIVNIKTPSVKAGDRVTFEFLVPETTTPIIEKSQIVKLYIQVFEKKPQYYAEIHFLKPNDNNIKIIENFQHQLEIKRIANAAEKRRNASKKKKK